MPQVITLPDPSGLAQGITQGASALARGLGEGYTRYAELQRKKQEEEKQLQQATVLADVLKDLGPEASPLQVMQAFSSAAADANISPEMISKYGTLYATLQKTQPKRPGEPITEDQVMKMADLFKKFGMPQDIALRNAELWGQLTVGGQTEMARYLVDQISRQSFKDNQETPDLGFEEMAPESVVSSSEQTTFDFPKIDIFEDRTPKEKSKFKAELLKSNSPDYKENNEKLRSLNKEIMSYQQLDRLNETNKLPQGLQRWNVNWTTGELNIPALSTPEAQLFVKTINDFTVKAKDTFGARVTNFDLSSFMKRLPTLANTKEGRRLIIEQAKNITEIDRLYRDGLKKVYDKYGLQKIDRQNAEKIAEDLIKDDLDQLKKNHETILERQTGRIAREKAPADHLPMKSPSGKIGYMPLKDVEKAKKKGYKLL